MRRRYVIVMLFRQKTFRLPRAFDPPDEWTAWSPYRWNVTHLSTFHVLVRGRHDDGMSSDARSYGRRRREEKTRRDDGQLPGASLRSAAPTAVSEFFIRE